jgi:hypothetical protein
LATPKTRRSGAAAAAESNKADNVVCATRSAYFTARLSVEEFERSAERDAFSVSAPLINKKMTSRMMTRFFRYVRSACSDAARIDDQ